MLKHDTRTKVANEGGKKLREAWKQSGKSLREWGEEQRISYAALHRYMTGVTLPSIHTAFKMKTNYGIPMEDWVKEI